MLFKKSIVLTLTLLMILGSMAFVFSSVAAQDKPYEDTQINVLVWRDEHTKAVKEKVSEFEEMTGIDVVIDDLPTQSLTQKMAMNVTTETGKYDLVAVDEPYVPQFANYFVNYKDWPSPKVMDKKIQLSAIPEGAVTAAAWNNNIKGLPINANAYIMIYRKDLVEDEENQKAFKEEYGYELQAPDTLEQLHDMSEFFYNPDEMMYGYAPFTVKSEGATVEAMWLLRSFGVDILNEDLEVVLDVDEAVEALNYYQSLLDFGPPSKLSMGHPETIQNVNAGNVFATLQWPAIIAGHENPDNSTVAGKLGYPLNPEGPGGRAAITGVWSLTMPKASENKQAAAEFAYWWGSYESGKELIEAGMSPIRKDLLTDPQLQKDHPWYKSVLANLDKAAVHRPRFPEYMKVSDKVQLYFAKVISNDMEPREAMTEMKSEIETIIEEYKND